MRTKFVAISAIGILIMSMATLISIEMVTQNYNEIIYQTTFETLSLMTKNIENDMRQIELLSEYLTTDTVIQRELDAINEKDAYDKKNAVNALQERVYTYASGDLYVEGIHILYDTGEYISNTTNTGALPIGINQRLEFMEMGQAHKGGATWTLYKQGKETIVCIREIRKIKELSLESMGVLVIQVDLRKLIEKNRIQGFSDPNKEAEDIYLFSKDELVYPKEAASYEKAQWRTYQGEKGYEIVELLGAKHFVTYTQMDALALESVLVTPYEKIYRGNKVAKDMMLGMTIIALSIAITVSALLTDHLLKKFDTLLLAMKKFKGDNLPLQKEIEMYKDRTDEIGFLYSSFSKMTKNIYVLVHENLKKQILLKDTQVKMLMQQMNPHFLYNTLNSINWMAKLNQQHKISEMVESLAVLLRATLTNQEDIITLKEEIDMINSYICIQTIRYGARLQFDLQIEEEALVYRVPKLSIQPLVENSIHHVLEEAEEGCKIQVLAFVEKDLLKVVVKDTGKGIEPNILEQIHKKEIKTRNTGIGLTNIEERVHLLFGKEYGLSFYKEKNYGVVCLVLPCIEETYS